MVLEIYQYQTQVQLLFTSTMLRMDGVGEAVPLGQGLVRYLQLHLHQEDSVMVGEDLVYSLTVTLL